jgi:hypothetical protein
MNLHAHVARLRKPRAQCVRKPRAQCEAAIYHSISFFSFSFFIQIFLRIVCVYA